MYWGQMAIGDALHQEINRCRSCLGSFSSFTQLEWFALSSLLLMHVLGQCPDVAAARDSMSAAIGGKSFNAVLEAFQRILDGRGFHGLPGSGSEGGPDRR